MKRDRDPMTVLKRSEPPLPLSQRILCALIVTLIIAAVWWSVWMDRR